MSRLRMKPPVSGAFTTGPSWTDAALKPRDKGPAESLVNQTYRYYYNRIGRDTFFSHDELNGRLDELNDMFNDRPRKNKTYSRREQYERGEVHICAHCRQSPSS